MRPDVLWWLHDRVWEINVKNNAAIALCLVSLANVFAEANASDCALKRLASVDLVVAQEILVPVVVGERQMPMKLSTSAAFNGISEEAVTSLGLRRRQLASNILLQGAHGRAKDYVAVDPLQIGNVRIHDVTFVIDTVPDQGSQSLGTLGMTVFSRVDLELDLAHKKLALYSQDHCPGKVVYWSDHWAAIPMYRSETDNMYFPVELEGKKLEATIATGINTSSLEEAVSRRLYGFDEHSPDIDMRPGEDGRLRAHYRAMKITANGLEVTNADVVLQPTWEKCKLTLDKAPSHAVGFDGCLSRYPLVLGRDVLEKLHLYFAMGEKVLYFTGADASKDVVPGRTD
jgi:hypothetical protein